MYHLNASFDDRLVGYIEREEGYYKLYAPHKESSISGNIVSVPIFCKYCDNLICHRASQMPVYDVLCLECVDLDLREINSLTKTDRSDIQSNKENNMSTTHNYREKKLIENAWKVIGGLSQVPEYGLCVYIQSPGTISTSAAAWMCYETGHIHWHQGGNETWDELASRNFTPPKGKD